MADQTTESDLHISTHNQENAEVYPVDEPNITTVSGIDETTDTTHINGDKTENHVTTAENTVTRLEISVDDKKDSTLVETTTLVASKGENGQASQSQCSDDLKAPKFPQEDENVKLTKIKSWSEKKASVDFTDINDLTPLTDHIKLRQAVPKVSGQNIITVDNDVLFVIDFHSHIVDQAVAGFLFGLIDTNTESVRVVDVLPIIYGFSEDESVEEKRKNTVMRILEAGKENEPDYVLIGAYISHLDRQPEPTINDIKYFDKLTKEYGSLIHNNNFFIIVISPYFDPKNVANIESPYNAFRLNPTIRSPTDIALPVKCEIKRNDTEISEDSLRHIKYLAYVSNDLGLMINMSDVYWHKISLRSKLIASCMQFTKSNINQDEIVKTLTLLTS